MRIVAVTVVAVAALSGALVGCTDQDVTPPAASSSAVPTSAPTSAPASPSSPPTPASPTPVSPTSSPSPPSVLHAGFDGERAHEFAVRLADEVGARVAGTEADLQARIRVGQALRTAGWDVTVDPFALPQGGESANLIAAVGPLPAAGEPHVVVGGHLDTVPDTPGANDNATGIGVIVALAEELADEAAQLPLPVVLVAFGAEEYQPGTRVHHVGSEHLAAAREGVVAMLSIDMVGNGPVTLAVGLEGADRTLVRRLAAAAEAAGIADVVPDTRGDISDHGPFAKRGVPAAFLWTGRDGRYHTPGDTSEHLDRDDIQRAGDLALTWLRGLTPADRDGLEDVAVTG